MLRESCELRDQVLMSSLRGRYGKGRTKHGVIRARPGRARTLRQNKELRESNTKSLVIQAGKRVTDSEPRAQGILTATYEHMLEPNLV